MPINKKSKFNNFVAWLHLWLGLVSGIVVFILGITGCIFSFQREISNIVYKKILFVDNKTINSSPLPFHILKDNAQKILGKNKPITYITTYPNSNHTWEFMCYRPGDDNAFSIFSSIKNYESVFVNPYSGDVTGHINYMREFFAIDKCIHISLLLNPKYGEPIVGTATLIFVILLITGFIMWYPKNLKKKNRDAVFKIKWRAKWKRLNYDLHNVAGFYTCVVAFIIACTGLVMSFNWFKSLVYVAASASITPPDFKQYRSDTTHMINSQNTFDIVFETANKIYPNANRIGIAVPTSNADAINVTAYHTKDVYYNDDNLYFDQSNGKLLGTQLYKKQNNGVKLITMNYDIHIGSVGGIAGKIIVFLVGLIAASLPITGLIIWLNKKKKKRNKILDKTNHQE